VIDLREGARSTSQVAARLREKCPAANRPAKKLTNEQKEANHRSGFEYLHPDTRLYIYYSHIHS